eukprot:1146993-Pelagomonas_calceolata.AAC.5
MRKPRSGRCPDIFFKRAYTCSEAKAALLLEQDHHIKDCTITQYCEDTRPQHQLNAAKQQHADLCKLISAKAATIHPILLGVGGTIYTEHTLKQFKQLGLDH